MSNRYYRRKIQLNVPMRRKSQRNNLFRSPVVPSELLKLPIAPPPPFTHSPFRWDIARREQLGSLLEGDSTFEKPGFAEELTVTATQIIASAGDSDLVFLGRSPESLFDLLRGVLRGTSWRDRTRLLPFSLGRSRHDDIPTPKALAAYRQILESYGLLPEQIASSTRPVAFIDIVASGTTFHNWIALLKRFAAESGADWNAIQRKIRIVGICRKEKTSPKTWRWQQHAPWLRELLGPFASVINVSVDAALYHHLADYQPKTTASYFPDRWGQPIDKTAIHQEKYLEALRQARTLFEIGTRKRCRLLFAQELGNQWAIRYPWLRQLIGELKRSANGKD